MADDSEIIVGVGADTDPLKKGLKDAGEQVDEFGKKVDKASKSEKGAADKTEELTGKLSDLGGHLQGVGGKVGQAGTLIKKMSGSAASAATSIGTVATVSTGAILALTGIGAILAVGAIAVYKNRDAILEYVAGINDMTRAFDAAAPAIGKEIGQLTQLVTAYNDVNTSAEDKGRIMAKLQKDYPSYFGDLDTEKATVDEVTKAYDLQKKAIVGNGILKALEAQKAPIYAKMAKLEAKTQLSLLDQIGLALKTFSTGVPVSGLIGDAILGDGTTVLEDELKKLNEASKKVIEKYGLKPEDFLGLGADKKEPTDEDRNRVEALTGLPTADEFFEYSKMAKSAFENIVNLYGGASVALSTVVEPLPPLIDPLKLTADEEALREHTENMKTILKDFNDAAADIINAEIAKTFVKIGEAIGEGMATGTFSIDQIGVILLEGLSSVLSQLGQLAIETGVGLLAITTALKTLNPYIAIAAGVALVALGSYVGNKAASIGSSAGAAGSSSGASRTGGVGSAVGGISSAEGQTSSVQRSSTNTGGGGGTYVFEIAGTKLIGVLQNTLNRNKALGGSNLTFG